MRSQQTDVTVNFAGALDTKTDPWQVSASNFLTLNNSVFTIGGELTKRNGFPGLGKTINASAITLTYSNLGGSLANARKILAYQDELLLNDAFNLYSYDESNNGWTYKGRSTIVGVSSAHVAQDFHPKLNMDSSIDTTSNVKIFAYYENDAFDLVFYSIQDRETGQFIVNKALFGNATTYSNPHCISIAGKSWVFALNTSDNKIYYQAIVGQTVTGSVTALVTDLNATDPFYDIDVVGSAIYLTYFTTGPAIKVALLDSSLAITASITKAENASHGVTLFGDGTNIWVVYNNGTATKAFVVNNAATVTVLAPTVVDGGATAANVLNVTGAWSSTQSKAFIFYDTTSTLINYNTLTLGGTPGTPSYFMRSVSLISKAWSISGIPHVVAEFPGNLQATYFVLNIYNLVPTSGAAFGPVPANIAAKVAPDLAGTVSSPGWLCRWNNPSSLVYELALAEKTNVSLATSATTVYSPAGVIDCTLDFNLSNPSSQVLGNNAQIASGEVIMYDGSSVVEQNFHIYPEITSVANSAGGSLSAGTYGYQVTYEWLDNQGQQHRSSPSPVSSVVALINTKNTLVIPTLRVTNKTNVAINIYRTEANGSVYYLITTAFFQAFNNSAADSVSVDDGNADSAIIGNNQLYTTGELEDFAPPAASAMTVFKNRIFYIDSENGSVGYSKQVQIGFPVEFVPEFILNIGTAGGTPVALDGMDDKLIFFKSGLETGPSILYMVGTGPAASGANNDFTDPLPVAVDCGCVDRSSIVLTPSGLIFKSDKGIYMLDRNLQASYIGAAVEGFNQYSVLSSQLIPNTTQVRFLLSSGTLLMYDYFFGKWATFSNPAGISDCIFQGQHTYVDSAGQVYKEAPGVYYDGTNTPVLVSFTTPYLNFAGISGYERIYSLAFLGKYLSAHQLSVQIGYDYQALSQSATITPKTAPALEQWRIDAKRQLCQAFQISLTEVYTGTLGASFTMSGITYSLGIKSKIRPIKGVSSVGFS